MTEFIKEAGATAERVLSKPYFWIALASVIAVLILVTLYRKFKLQALSRMEYSRYFSTDGVFAGEDFTLTEYDPWPAIKAPMSF